MPAVRGCYRTHLGHLDPAAPTSRDPHLRRTPSIASPLLPALPGPTLPSEWPHLPLVSLYERAGVVC